MKKITYIELQKEVKKIGELYRESELEEARKCYEQYVQLVLTDANISNLERNFLFDLWEDLK